MENSEENLKNNCREILNNLTGNSESSETPPTPKAPIWNRITRRRFNSAMKKAQRKGLAAGTKEWSQHFKKYGFNL